MSPPTLLIPITFPDPTIHPLTDINVDTLDGFNIVLLGYWEISGHATAEAARNAHETKAEAVLYEIAAAFSYAGASTDIQLHFGPGGPKKRDLQARIVEDADPDGVLLAAQLSTLRNVLVPLRDNRHKDSIVRFVSAFDSDSIFVVELYHAVREREAVEAGEKMLTTVKEELLTRGFSESDLELTVEVVNDAKTGIGRKAQSHNIVVLGETEELNADNRVFGSISDYLATQTNTPVIIVR